MRNFALTDAIPIIILSIGIVARGGYLLATANGWPPAYGYHPIEAWLPLATWGWVWITVGAVCVTTALSHSSRAQALAIGAGVGLNLAWGFSFLWSGLSGGMEQGVAASIGCFSIAALVGWIVWRGPVKSGPEITREEIAHELRHGHGGA